MEISKKSKVWVYQSDRPFSSKEESSISEIINNFINQWEAHGSKLASKAEIRYSRFIILMVDEEHAGATGCSIDKSVNLMRQIEDRFELNLLNRFNIAYRDENRISSRNRDEFEALITEGKVTENTIVFNNLVQTVEELDTKWEVPFKNSWHAKVFANLINA